MDIKFLLIFVLFSLSLITILLLIDYYLRLRFVWIQHHQLLLKLCLLFLVVIGRSHVLVPFQKQIIKCVIIILYATKGRWPVVRQPCRDLRRGDLLILSNSLVIIIQQIGGPCLLL